MKTKREYPDNFKTKMGFFMAPFTATMGTMGVSYFSMFLTDYAGIDSAMGKTGFAAAFATIFLIITRIIDALDDPLQGWILDSAKERKFGKYRMFGFIGVAMVTIGIIMMYGLPKIVKGNVIGLWVWVLIGYLILETGSAMGAVTTPLLQKVTTNTQTRSKLTAFFRMGCVIASIPFLFYVTIITLIGYSTGNLGEAASVTTILFCLVFSLVSVVGLLFIKEPYREKANEDHKAKISVKEIINLCKTNRPLWCHCIGVFIGGLATGVSPLYFVRWKFCADMVTGEVDLVKFAAYSGVLSIIMLVPNFLCPVIVPFLIKKFKAPDRCIRACYLLTMTVCALIFIFNAVGILTPIVLFVLCFFSGISTGISTMMIILLVTECADYAEYNLGRNMTALVSSIYNLTVKASSVIGTALPGALLAIVGYSVSAETGAYAGDLSNLPRMINGLGLLLGPVPFVFALIAFFVYKFGYKITPEYRAEMQASLEKKHELQSKE